MGEDWTVQWERKWLQLTKENRVLNLAGKKVRVRQTLEGKLQLLYQGKKLKWKELPGRPKRLREEKEVGDESKKEPVRSSWENFGRAAGKGHWRKARSEDLPRMREVP